MNQTVQFLQANGGEMFYKTWEHLYISLIAVMAGILAAVPLGVVLTRMKRGAGAVIGIVNIIQTLPSLAILAFFIPLLGVGKIPAVAALFFYSMLPILRNTYTGILGVNRHLLESGKGIGMTAWEQIRLVELPLAAPSHHGGHQDVFDLFNRLGDARLLYRRRRAGRLHFYRLKPLSAGVYYRRRRSGHDAGGSRRLHAGDDRTESHA